MKVFQKTGIFFLVLFLMLYTMAFSFPVLANADAVDDFTIDEHGVLLHYQGEGGEVKIPEGIVEIGSSAFGMSKVTKVEIPKGVQKIGNSAFEKSSLTEIVIPEGVTSIGDFAFQDCKQLNQVQISKSVTQIGRQAFTGSLWMEKYPNDMVIVNNILLKYKNTDATVVTLPKGLKVINIGALGGLKKMTSVSIPNTVTSIGEDAFASSTALKNVVIPDSVTTIGASAFERCQALTSVTLSKNVRVLEYSLFARCTSLKKIVIPEGITSIKNYVFYECSSLSEVTLPNSLISMESPFFECFNLKSIVFPDKYVNIIGQFYQTSDPEMSNSIRSTYHDFIIYGKKNSAAATYANMNDYSFRVIGEDLIYLPGGLLSYSGRAYCGAVTMDTRTYTMAPGNIYDIGVKLAGNAQVKIRKMTSSRDGIASVRQLPNGNYRVSGLRPGTTYITYTIYDPDSGKEITHASVKFDVVAGVKQHGIACRQSTYFN